jgi:hypothetical protein
MRSGLVHGPGGMAHGHVPRDMTTPCRTVPNVHRTRGRAGTHATHGSSPLRRRWPFNPCRALYRGLSPPSHSPSGGRNCRLGPRRRADHARPSKERRRRPRDGPQRHQRRGQNGTLTPDPSTDFVGTSPSMTALVPPTPCRFASRATTSHGHGGRAQSWHEPNAIPFFHGPRRLAGTVDPRAGGPPAPSQVRHSPSGQGTRRGRTPSPSRSAGRTGGPHRFPQRPRGHR